MDNRVNFQTLVRELEKRLESKKPGTMFISPEDGHPVAVAFRDGAVAGISSGPILGKAALERLAKVERASYNFGSTPVILPGSEIGPGEVFQVLGLHGGGAASSPPAASPASHGTGAGFQGRAIALVREGLIDILGPFAVVVMEEALQSLPPGGFRAPSDLGDFLGKLAREIEDPQEAGRFIRQTDAALRKL